MFATKMLKYIGKPFKEGGTGPDSYDCVGFIYRYLTDNKKPIPATFKTWTLDDYYDLARGSKAREVSELRDWMLTLGQEIPVSQIVAGDIILVSIGDGVDFVVLYAGNNHAISVSVKYGVRVIAISKHIKPVLAVRP